MEMYFYVRQWKKRLMKIGQHFMTLWILVCIWHMHQELADAAAYATLRVHSPDGSSFLSEMTPWPTSWKCAVKQAISDSVRRCVFTSKTTRSSFSLTWFEMKELFRNGRQLQSMTSNNKSDSVNRCTLNTYIREEHSCQISSRYMRSRSLGLFWSSWSKKA